MEASGLGRTNIVVVERELVRPTGNCCYVNETHCFDLPFFAPMKAKRYCANQKEDGEVLYVLFWDLKILLWG